MNKEDIMTDKEKKDKSKEKYNNVDKKSNDNTGNILDKLFYKTKTKPYIYYLPLTKEQVKEKLEKKKAI